MEATKKPIKNVDIYNENFNNYFVEHLNRITPEQRGLIPEELNIKIFKRGNTASAERLNFQEKMYILSVVFKRKVTLKIEDLENGLTVKDYANAKKAQAGKYPNLQAAEDMRSHAAFVLADRDLMNAELYLNHLSSSNIYTLVKAIIPNTNHKIEKKYTENKAIIQRVFKFLENYESKKKRIRTDYQITMPEWYALVYFANGERLGLDFYDKDMKYAYSSNRRVLHRALQRLTEIGLLQRSGPLKSHKYKLTSRGINVLDRIFNNIILNY